MTIKAPSATSVSTYSINWSSTIVVFAPRPIRIINSAIHVPINETNWIMWRIFFPQLDHVEGLFLCSFLDKAIWSANIYSTDFCTAPYSWSITNNYNSKFSVFAHKLVLHSTAWASNYSCAIHPQGPSFLYVLLIPISSNLLTTCKIPTLHAWLKADEPEFWGMVSSMCGAMISQGFIGVLHSYLFYRVSVMELSFLYWYAFCNGIIP